MEDDQLPYMDLIPEEHKIRKDGRIHLTELGVIHLCTIVEQKHPEKAEKARHLRLSVSAHCQKLRADG
jgi:hypothetical protein